MALTGLLCPRCGTPARPGVGMPHWGAIHKYDCPACGLQTFEEELIPERKWRSLLGGAPPTSSGHVPTFGLLATLGWTTNMLRSFSVGADGGVNNPKQTAAQSHDSSDATYDQMTTVDASTSDGINTLIVHQVLAVLSGSATGTISYLRFKVRGSLLNGHTTLAATLTPTVNASNGAILSSYPANNLTASWQTFTYDSTVEPVSSQPWTWSLVAANHFGAVMLGQTDLDTLTTYFSEFTIEAWGYV